MRSAVFGMQPRSPMPLGLRFQKELRLVPGMIATAGVDEVLLVCRREPDR